MAPIAFVSINSAHLIYKEHNTRKIVIFWTADNHLYLVLSCRFIGSSYLLKNLNKWIVIKAGNQLHRSIFHQLLQVRL